MAQKQKSNKPQKLGSGKQDCYFEKVERFELNMTGLHFVHACTFWLLINKYSKINSYKGRKK